MKIPLSLLTVFLGAVLSVLIGLEAWTLIEVVNLKVEMASIKTQLNQQHQIAQK